MAHVVTQSCCADASCVVACPVNCIHPAPGEPGFAEAEMVYIDANSCVGCGACVTACPVGAIVPDRLLTDAQRPFLDINADYYDVFPHADRTPLALVPEQRRLGRSGPFRVAIVGSGPAGLYAADELLKHPEVAEVVVHDRLRTPYGLVRFGVAPDHGATKQVTRLFEDIESDPRFRYRLGVEVGTDLTLDHLRAEYDAVVYAVGASADRGLDIPGEELPGSVAATDLVGWYNGHPDQQALEVPLDAAANPSGRAVVIGNGNVALDVARILTGDPDALADTEIDRDALAALRDSAVREVVVLGRRGPAEAAFTAPELVGLAGLTDVDVIVDCDPALLTGDDRTVQLLREIAQRPIDPDSTRRRIVLRFAASPVAITGSGGAVTGLRVVRNRLVSGDDGRVRPQPTEEYDDLPAGLVVRSIGFRGRPVTGLPFDEATGTVPNDRGRVQPGVYVAGWIKRGPSGFIGTNKTCAQETVDRILDDLDSGATGRVGANSAPSASSRRELTGVGADSA